MSSRSSVDRAPGRCSGGHGFRFLSGTQNFSLSHARVMLINSPSQDLHFTFFFYLQFANIGSERALFSSSYLLIHVCSCDLSIKRPYSVEWPAKIWTVFVIIMSRDLSSTFLNVPTDKQKCKTFRFLKILTYVAHLKPFGVTWKDRYTVEI